MLRLLKKLQTSADFWFVVITSLVLFLMRFPSFFEPYWYGDEGIYEVIGFALRHGRLLYRDIWDNKPPLLYLIYAIGSGDQTTARILSFLFGLGAIVVFFFLAKKLLEKSLLAYIATGFFTAFLGLPLLEGNIANAENFMVLPITLAGLLIVRFVQQDEKISINAKNLLVLFVAGLLLGFAFLIKVVGVFDFSAFTLFLAFCLLHNITKKTLLKVVSFVISLGIGFFLPLVATVAFFFAHGAFKTFLQSAFSNNVGYVNYGNQFIIPQGLLVIKLILLAGIVGFLFLKRRSLPLAHIFIYLWLSFSVFSALFSQRPYTHYVLVVIGSFSLLLGLGFYKKHVQILTLVGIAILTIFMLKNFYVSDRSIGYYINFIQYITNQKDTMHYQAYFDRIVPRDYALADFINQHKSNNDSIFIWGNSGQIYRLTNTLPPGRYIVEYHMTNPAGLAETATALKRSSPKFIILISDATSFPYSMKQYKQVFAMQGALLYEKVF